MTDQSSGQTPGSPQTPPAPGTPVLTIDVTTFLQAIDNLTQAFTDSLATLAQMRSIVQPSQPQISVITPGAGEAVLGSDTWSIRSDMMILKNGQPAYKGWQSKKMAEIGGVVWVQGLDGNYYEWNGKDFVAGSNPGF